MRKVFYLVYDVAYIRPSGNKNKYCSIYLRVLGMDVPHHRFDQRRAYLAVSLQVRKGFDCFWLVLFLGYYNYEGY